VHDLDGRLEQIHDLLARYGFEVAVEQDELATGTGIYNLYARRPGLGRGQGVAGSPNRTAEIGGPELTVSELQAFLRERLPEFMLPSDLVLLEDLPYTRSGKVDRKGLPAPEEVQRESERPVAAPRHPFEEVLVGIWSEVLQKSPIGIEDNFFELGGHSLLATQLVSRVRSAFSIELPLRTLFEHPTVAELAHQVRQAREAGLGLAVPPIVPVPRTGELPLSFAQQRLWFLDQLGQGSSFYNSPHPLRLKGALNVSALRLTLSEIVRRHEVLRTSFPAVDNHPVQRIVSAGLLRLPIVDLGGLTEETQASEVRRLVDEDAGLPFDLSRGPLLRVVLVRRSELDHVVFFTTHHVVNDGWSMGVLVGEVSTLYQAFCAGRPSPLPELRIQYADFAAWQREVLESEMLEKQLAFWKQQLGGDLPILILPTDRPRLPVQTYRGALAFQAFPEELYGKLKQLSRQTGSTLFMTLLAGYFVLLHRLTGADDIVVGTAVAGRNRAETEGLIGFFINMLPIRVGLLQNPDFLQLLSRTREATLGAFTCQDVPLEKLIEELQPKRYGSHAPLFQVAFGLRHEAEHRLELPGVTLEPVEIEHDSSRLDLSLWMQESGGKLEGHWFYNVDLFEAATIRKLMNRFETLLSGVAAQPETLVSSLEIYSEAEKKELEEADKKRLGINFKDMSASRRKGISVAGGSAG
jgi:acyl carrier protein